MNERFMLEGGNLFDAVAYSASKCAEGAALIYMGKTISYATLMRKIDRVAQALIGANVKAGDVVTVCLPNIPQAVYLFYAINKIGAVAHLVHPLTTAQQMVDYLIGIDTKLIFTLSSGSSKFNEIAAYRKILIIGCDPTEELDMVRHFVYNLKNKADTGELILSFKHFVSTFIKGNTQINKAKEAEQNAGNKSVINADEAGFVATNAPKFVPEKTDYLGASVLLHSGGTCGNPKVIALTQDSINNLAANGTDILNISDARGKYMLSVLPMFHGFGMCMGIHAMLAHCGCNVIMPKFNRNGVIKLLKAGKITYMIGVPILYEALLSHPKFYGDILRGIDVAFVGGDFVAKSLLTRFDNRIAESGGKGRLFEGYGLTETVTVCAVNTHTSNKTGSVGSPVGSINIEAFDFSGAQPKMLDRGEKGEFAVSGNTLMNGYVFDKINATLFNCNGKKWVRTGDYGHVDSDGFVFFLQRLKRIIKVNGINVFPSEIENLVMENCGCTNACALEKSSAKHGNIVKLFVAVDSHINQIGLRASLLADIENRLGKYAVPSEIVFMDKLPTTSVGKVDASKLS